VSPLANGGRPWKRERKRVLMRKLVELEIFCWKIRIVGILEIDKSFGLERKERKIEKRKRKEFDK